MLIVGLAYQVGSADAIARLRGVHLPVLGLVVVILAVNVFFVTPRWAIILSALDYPIKFSALVSSVFLGFLFNQILPTGVGGDILRAWRARQLGVPLNVGLHSVILDRAAGLFVVFISTAVLLPLSHPLIGQSSLVQAMVLLLAGGGLACAGLWAFGRTPMSSVRAIGRIQNSFVAFLGSLRSLARRPMSILGILALSMLGQLLAVVAIWLLAQELLINIGIVEIAVVTFGAMLAAAIPFSIAGWGIREGALILLFGGYGVPADAAFTVSILFGISLILAASPGLIVLARPYR
jgi:uncharacterized membrane protein YbhN (UPF0104 family)